MHTIFNIKTFTYITVALLAFSYSFKAVALSMGDIQVKSTLGQPLLAQVKVTATDNAVDESCFNVTSEDPENGLMLMYNLSDALITIHSQHPVVKPAMVLTLFNHCHVPSKRNYIFFVNAQDPITNSQNSKNETSKKILGDQFHYQRTFNKLTKQTQQESKSLGLPDRFVYEDQVRENRIDSNNMPASAADIQADNKTTSQIGEVSNKPSKNTKLADKALNKASLNTSVKAKTPDNPLGNPVASSTAKEKHQPNPYKPSVENSLALSKSIHAPETKIQASITPESNISGDNSNQTETKPPSITPVLNTADSQEAISTYSNVDGNTAVDLTSAESNLLISEEQLQAEKRMLELQSQLTELYQINSSLDNLFKKLNLDLAQVKKENDFFRILTLCLGSSLLISGYFFSYWLRHNRNHPAFVREPEAWATQNPTVKPLSTDEQISATNSLNSSMVNTATSANDNVLSNVGFVEANDETSPNNTLPTTTKASDPELSKHISLNDNHTFSAADAKWFDLGDTVFSAHALQNIPSDALNTNTNNPEELSPSQSEMQPKTAQPPVSTLTRAALPITLPDITFESSTINPAKAASPSVENDASESKKDIIKLQPAGVMDDVDVFLSHGRTNLAIQLLQNYLMEHPKESALIWIFLLDLLAKEGKRREYEITTEECRKHFNIKLSNFSVPLSQNDSIESFERISAALQKIWGTPLVLSFIDELIYNTRLVPRIGFSRAIFEELMFLRELAEEELLLDQMQIEQTSASLASREVSVEFKQLAEDLKVQDQRNQDVNQYLSQFEFNLEDLSK